MISLLFYPFFKNLLNPPSTPPDPSKYLNEISAAPTDEILQTLPQSPLITHKDIHSAI